MIYIILKRNRGLFYVSAFIFFLGTLFGTTFHVSGKKQSILAFPPSTMDLFLNNVEASLFIASGFIVFGISSFIFLASNGCIVGVTVKQSLMNGMTMGEVFLKLLPHGIFEVPALLLGGVIGFKGIPFLIRLYMYQQPLREELIRLFQDICFIGALIFILLLLAAAIEWHVTL